MFPDEEIDFQTEKETYYLRLISALDPPFEFGTSQILPFYQDALELLAEIDDEFKVTDEQERLKINGAILKFMNTISKDCHRSELINAVFLAVSEFKNNLKDLPFQKEGIKLSCWDKYFNILPLPQGLQKVQESLRKQMLTILDYQFSEGGKISMLNRFLITKPHVAIRISNCQKHLFNDNYDKSLDRSQFYFIGVIAASTFGSRYLWNQMAQKFILHKGDPDWLTEGLQCQKIPKYFKLLSKISCNLAYNMPEFMSQETIDSIIADEEPNSTRFTKSLMALCLYQMQACLCLSHGILPRSIEYEKYLQKPNFKDASKKSFQTLEQFEEQNEEKYNFLGQRFTKLYQKPVKISDSDSQESQKNDKSFNKQNILAIILEQKEKTEIKDLGTVKTLRQIYGKYALFNDGCFERKNQLTPIENEEQFSLGSEKQGKKIKYYRFDTDKYLENEDWLLQNALEVIQLRMKHEQLKSVKLLMDSLKAKKQFSKNNQSYIQSLFNYFYQHVDYPKLVQKQIKPIERYFIKVILEYPYFLNEQIFNELAERMNNSDLSLYIMDILSYKMESNILMIGKALESASSKKIELNMMK